MTSLAQRTLAALSLLALLAPAAPAPTEDDWPEFRGPGRDARSNFRGLRSPWPTDGPPELWRTPLQGGYSGISVASGRAVTMTHGDAERVIAFDVADGREIWSTRIDEVHRDGQGDGPRSTPTIDGGRLFALSARGTLGAFSSDDGRLLWSRDLRADFGASAPTWGYATSPLVHGDRLLVEAGGAEGAAIVALDKATGAELWRSQGDRAGYSTPILVGLGGEPIAIFFTGVRILGLVPGDGRTLWSAPWRTAYGVNAATPVWVPPNRIFVSSGYDVGSALFEVADGELREVWRNREMKNQFSSSLYLDGYLYGFDNSMLECLDITSGERMWRTRGFGHGSLLYADGHLVILGEQGTLALVEADPGAYRELSRAEPLSGRTWTMPSLADGILYVRSERELVALDLRDTSSR